MMKRLVQATPVENRINLTPVIDVALVLVIILLVTAPMLAVAELGLTLPEARAVRFDDENRINVSLGKDGRVAIGERIIPRDVFIRELSSELSERAEDSPLVVVRADTVMSHGLVRALLSDATAAGATRIAFATNPPTEVQR
jgi:biopolymer transport protein ExbD